MNLSKLKRYASYIFSTENPTPFKLLNIESINHFSHKSHLELFLSLLSERSNGNNKIDEKHVSQNKLGCQST